MDFFVYFSLFMYIHTGIKVGAVTSLVEQQVKLPPGSLAFLMRNAAAILIHFLCDVFRKAAEHDPSTWPPTTTLGNQD